jgi:hypothetical protein
MRHPLTFLLLVFICAGCAKKAPPRFTVDEILQAYLKDQINRGDTFDNKLVIVTGEVYLSDMEAEKPYFFLKSNTSGKALLCEFSDWGDLAEIKDGMTVTIRGTCMSNPISVRHCELESSEK